MDSISAASGASNSSGIVTFTVTSTTAGNPSFTATDTTDSNLFITPSAASVTFTAGLATQVAFTTTPGTTATAGVNFSTQPVVNIYDTNSNTVTGASGTVTLTAYTTSDCSTTAGTGTLNSNTQSISSGVATFSGTNYTKSDTIYLKASTGSLSTACTATSIAVSAASENKVVFTTTPGTTATAGAAFATQPVVKVYDTYNNTVTSSSDIITLTAYTTSDCSTTAGTGTLNSGTHAASSGVATFSGTNYTKSDTIYLRASTGSLTTACTATSIAVGATSENKVVFTTTPGTTATAGTAFSTQPAVTVYDTYNNVVTGSSDVITLAAYTTSDCSSTAGTGTLNSNTQSAASGVATFSGTNYTTNHTIYLKASTGTLTTACTATSIAVSVAAENKVLFTTTPGTTATAGTAFTTQPVVKIYDTYNNLVSGSSDIITLAAYTTSDCSTTAGTGTLNSNTQAAAAGSPPSQVRITPQPKRFT